MHKGKSTFSGYLRSIAAILAIGLAGWCVVGWIAYASECNWTKPQGNFCLVVKPFYDWQNAIAGLFAVAGAYVALAGIRGQIAQVDRLSEERRRREERAAMAALPLTLSELTQYALDSIKLLEPHLRTSVTTLPPDIAAPRIPPNAASALQLCARHADSDIVDKIAKALGKLQVQHSRLQEWIREIHEEGGSIRPTKKLEGLGYMKDAADLHAAIVDLFSYSRNETLVRQQASLQQLTSALHNADLWDDSHPIWEHIRPRRDDDGCC